MAESAGPVTVPRSCFRPRAAFRGLFPGANREKARNGSDAGKCLAKGIKAERAEVESVAVERFQIEIGALAPAGVLARL